MFKLNALEDFFVCWEGLTVAETEMDPVTEAEFEILGVTDDESDIVGVTEAVRDTDIDCDTDMVADEDKEVEAEEVGKNDELIDFEAVMEAECDMEGVIEASSHTLVTIWFNNWVKLSDESTA